MKKAVQRAREEEFVFIYADTYLRLFLARENICDMTTSKNKFLKANFAFPVKKGFPYLGMFNQRSITKVTRF